MKILFSFTLQGQTDVDNCLKLVKESHIPLTKCRFCYCDLKTKQYLLDKQIGEQFIIQSCGLGRDLDHPLNAMRLSKNKPDYTIVGIRNTRIIRYNEFESILTTIQSSFTNKLCLFTTKFMYPYRQHIENTIDSRIVICNGIHKELMNNYVDTCEKLDKEYVDKNIKNYPREFNYTSRDVLENMNMSDYININFTKLKYQTLFQQVFLAFLSDYQ